MTGRLGLGASLAVTALIAAACAGGVTSTAAPAKSATPATPAPATATQAATTAPAVATAAPAAPTSASCEVVADGTGTPATIKSFAFPSGLTVKAGEAVAWTNSDGAPHTVTFDDGTCASGKIAGGATVVVRYTTPGTYAFHCAIHASMTGTIKVN